MLEEQAYLPFTCEALPAGPWLVLVPHPDDESFGMGGTLALARAAGIAVDLLILTDGALGGSSPDLPAQREAETHEAARVLGVRAVDFLRAADRNLTVSDAVIARVVERLRGAPYASLFFPSPVEPHPDHRSAAQIGWEAHRRAGLGSDAFSYDISVQGPCNTLIDISTVVDVKLRAIACHASQIEHTPYTARVLGLNAARSWSLPTAVSHAEAFYRWPRRDAPLAALLDAARRPALSEAALPPAAELVSVIIRTVNRPVFLREAIRSVAAQTHARIELVLVVDGEEDFAGIVAEEAVGAIVAVQTVRTTPPRGRARAANAGMQAASGRYLCFLDDDDWLLPGHLSELVTRLRETRAPAAYGAVHGVQIEGSHETLVHVFDESFDPLRLAYRNFMPIHSVVFRRDVLDSGCAFHENLDLYEDWHFWLQVARLGDFLHLAKVTAKYRIGGSSGIGVPSTSRNVTEALDRFADASRSVWSEAQLRHLCVMAVAHENLLPRIASLEIALEKERGLLATALQEQQLAAHALQALQHEHDASAQQWQARYQLMVNSRSWQLARRIAWPIHVARMLRQRFFGK